MSYKTLYREPTWSEGPIFIKILYITFANWLKLLNIFGVHDCQKTSFDMADSLRTSTFLVTWIFYYWSFGLKQDNAISLFLNYQVGYKLKICYICNDRSVKCPILSPIYLICGPIFQQFWGPIKRENPNGMAACSILGRRFIMDNLIASKWLSD